MAKDLVCGMEVGEKKLWLLSCIEARPLTSARKLGGVYT
jgi:hypothetical protein